MSNGYPQKIIDNCINSFLNRKQSQNVHKIVPVDLEFTPIICLPYMGHPSWNYKKKLTSIFRSVGVKVKVVFRSFRVGNYFSLKSMRPVGLRARV